MTNYFQELLHDLGDTVSDALGTAFNQNARPMEAQGLGGQWRDQADGAFAQEGSTP